MRRSFINRKLREIITSNPVASAYGTANELWGFRASRSADLFLLALRILYRYIAVPVDFAFGLTSQTTDTLLYVRR